MKKKKAFTLIELLVVIAIIALLVSILMPALARAKELANRIKCQTQLSGIGKAIALYQNDFKEINPTVGFSKDGSMAGAFLQYYRINDTRWRNLAGSNSWLASYSRSDGWMYPTAGGCMWLLIKYEDLTPDMFLCPSAEEGEKMDLQVAIKGNLVMPETGPDQTGIINDWTDCIDFWTLRNWTYSYNDPWSRLLDTSANTGLVLLADKNPAYFRDDQSDPKANHNGQMDQRMIDSGIGCPDPLYNGTPSQYPVAADWSDDGGKNPNPGNSSNHSYEAQNVLYTDMHVERHETPLAGLYKDNIYTKWGANRYASNANQIAYKEIGVWGGKGDRSANTNDTYLMQ